MTLYLRAETWKCSSDVLLAERRRVCSSGSFTAVTGEKAARDKTRVWSWREVMSPSPKSRRSFFHNLVRNRVAVSRSDRLTRVTYIPSAAAGTRLRSYVTTGWLSSNRESSSAPIRPSSSSNEEAAAAVGPLEVRQRPPGFGWVWCVSIEEEEEEVCEQGVRGESRRAKVETPPPCSPPWWCQSGTS